TPILTSVAEGSGNYLVVIMVDKNGNYYYNTSTTATVVSDTAGSDPSKNTIFDGIGWTSFTPEVVPEPTVLALLALGIAGLVLKRKVA
ncbi:MAG: PEP-CTERM sorting domain-containing protein, partial [Kiritimatiellia bacterium]